MPAILGIDAAWTTTEPSGVALINRDDNGHWVCVAVAPSYESFIAIPDGNVVQWEQPPTSGRPEPGCLLTAAGKLLRGERVSVVSVDMAMSNVPITGRRVCDNEITRNFWAQGCSTHSPGIDRPGAISTTMLRGLSDCGYELAVNYAADRNNSVIEVYPHPALLSLLDRDYRIPYKVQRRRRYWPALSNPKRKTRLIGEFRNIRNGLNEVILGIPDFLPEHPEQVRTFTSLKRYEDALDALVCAWVGVRYLEGSARAYGDGNAAIWVPEPR